MSSTSPAVGRALDVLLYLASRPGPVHGSALIRDLGVPRSSAYHLLDVLVERGFVVHLPDQRAYALGVSAFEVGSAYLRHEPLEHIARPILKKLVASVNETAHLGILYGAESVYLLKEQPQVVRVPVTLVTDVGVRLPAHLTANGRSILAHLSAAQVRALFPSPASFISRTGRGPGSLNELRRLLQDERAQGWAEEVGLITDVVKRHEQDLTGVDCYVCGPPPMVEAAMAVLTTLGAHEKHIYYDKFTTTGSS